MSPEQNDTYLVRVTGGVIHRNTCRFARLGQRWVWADKNLAGWDGDNPRTNDATIGWLRACQVCHPNLEATR